MSRARTHDGKGRTTAMLTTAGGSSEPGGFTAIQVHGARVHNLKNLDVAIPCHRLVVITGPSGSGKSSLAFDTLHAEGQRQYLETLTPYLRRTIPQLERPAVDWIDGLPPTIAIDQRGGIPPPRSTVATLTEIYDFLRLLYVKIGELYCPQCQVPVTAQSAQEICETLLHLPEGTKVIILAPLPPGPRDTLKEAVNYARKLGFPRVRVSGRMYDLEEIPPDRGYDGASFEVVVDRLIVRPMVHNRLVESVHTALRISQGLLVASWESPKEDGENVWEDHLFSSTRHCSHCHQSYPEVDLRTLSFHSPYGACSQCEGFGQVERFDPQLVLDFSRGLEDGAVRLWKDARVALKHHAKKIERLMAEGGFDWSTPLAQIPQQFLDRLIYGSEKLWSSFREHSEAAKSKKKTGATRSGFVGLLHLLEVEYQLLADGRQRREWAAFRTQVPCPACGGSRLGPLGRSVMVRGVPIHQLCAMAVPEVAAFLSGLELAGFQQAVAAPILQQISARLNFLCQVGLDYLTLDRRAETLSGGELQRVRLAAGLGAALTDVCYIVDEPSVGLHPRDNDRLITTLRQLVEQGNTVIVVEHDEAVIRAADWVIDMGPGAGPHGGTIVAEGPISQILEDSRSLTGLCLSGKRTIPVPSRRRAPIPGRTLTLVGASANNLKNLTVEFPLGLLVCITGVSGSGKSSLVTLTLAPALRRYLLGLSAKTGSYEELKGVEHIDRVVDVDQTPIGRSPRSNVATFCGVFDEIRRVFAETKDARRLGFRPARFSFNNPAGRCVTCQGLGVQRLEMDFLPDVSITCPTCQGRRFNQQTLEVRYRGKNIAEVLEMSVDEGLQFFENFPTVERILKGLSEVGLGYLRLGQPATALSGGEAQRVKLATELARGKHGRTVYILDEPTTGLHKDDVRQLLDVLHRLVDAGNTVIVVEHHLDVIKSADWIIELGPEGGAAGGYLVAAGTPEQIANTQGSPTGHYLRAILSL